MSERFFVDEPVSLGRVMLTGAEAHHLIHVMRAGPGTHVTLFDGSGAEFPAVVQEVERGEAVLWALSRQEINRELPIDVTLGVALPKGDRQKWLIEKAVELGAARLAPLRTQRAVAQPVEQALARLRRVVVEASKQCGRNRLMQIDKPKNWLEFLVDSAGAPYRLLAHPGGFHKCPDLPISGGFPSGIFLAVGAEGGFTDEEASLAVAAGWHTVDLGPRILRVETAALLLLAQCVRHWMP